MCDVATKLSKPSVIKYEIHVTNSFVIILLTVYTGTWVHRHIPYQLFHLSQPTYCRRLHSVFTSAIQWQRLAFYCYISLFDAISPSLFQECNLCYQIIIPQSQALLNEIINDSFSSRHQLRCELDSSFIIITQGVSLPLSTCLPQLPVSRNVTPGRSNILD